MVNGPNLKDNRNESTSYSSAEVTHHCNSADFFNSYSPSSESPSSHTSSYHRRRRRGTERLKEGVILNSILLTTTFPWDMSKKPARIMSRRRSKKPCDHYTSKYAECATGRTLSVVWQCHKQAKELNECLHEFTNDSVLEEVKKEYALQQKEK